MQAEAPPPPAAAYVEEARVLEAYGARIPAALTRPEGGPAASAILLVPGSLFLDVDGNLPFMGAYTHPYADLARQLAARGHAVLRFAKLGPGTGSEVVDSVAAARHRRFATRVEVARIALDTLLAAAAGEGSVDGAVGDPPVVLAGHSEGAVVSSLLAAADGRVDGLVSLSGPSVGLYDIMREQLPLPPGSPPEAYAAFDSVVAALRRGEPIPAGVGSDPTTAPFAWMAAQGGADYVTEVDAVDPAAAIAAVSAPVLIVQGGRDGSVRPHHADRLAAARGALPTRLVGFPELQHMYKRIGPDVDPMTAFMIDDESDPAVAEAIDDWVRSEVRTTP